MGTPAPLKAPLNQELAKSFQQGKIRIDLLKPQELTHLIHLKKNVLAAWRYGEIKATKYDSQPSHQKTTRVINILRQLSADHSDFLTHRAPVKLCLRVFLR